MAAVLRSLAAIYSGIRKTTLAVVDLFRRDVRFGSQPPTLTNPMPNVRNITLLAIFRAVSLKRDSEQSLFLDSNSTRTLRMSNARSRYGYLPRRWRCISMALEGQVQLIYRTLTSTGSSLEDDELVLHAAADQLCGGVDRRLVLVHLGEFRGPDQRLSVADQFGTTGFTLLAGLSNRFVTVGSSMLIALQAGVG